MLFMARPAPAQWFPQASPTGNDLHSIAFPSDANIMLCGAGGTLLKKETNQSNWQTIRLNTIVDFNELAFPDAKTGYLVGDSGTVFKSVDGGNSWQKLSTPTVQELYSVCFTDTLLGWAAGRNGIILKTNNGGLSWEIVRQQENQTIRKILFLNPSVGWAVGDSGLILKSLDGGLSWLQVENDHTSNFYGIAFSDSAFGMIAGADSLLLTTSNGGADWLPAEIGAKGDLYAVHAIDSLTWWLGGSGRQQGLLIKSFTGGKLWTTVPNSLLSDIYDVKFVSPYTGYAVGKGGHIFVTETAGINDVRQVRLLSPPGGVVGLTPAPVFQWQADGDAQGYQLQLARDAQFNKTVLDTSLYAVAFEYENRLDYFSTYFWRVRSLTMLGPGPWSTVRSFRTGHKPPALLSPQNNIRDVTITPVLQWEQTDAPAYRIEVARDTAFSHLLFEETSEQPTLQTPRLSYDNKYYWRVKSLYENEESTWSAIFSFTTFNGLNGWIKQFSGSNQLLKEVLFVDNQNGWAVGTSGTILKTSDGGADWRPCDSGTPYHLESAYFFDQNNGLVCGWNGTILKTADGGFSWQTVVTPATYALRCITFNTDSTGWAVGEKGIILTSSDRGASWSVLATNPNQEYYQISFIDARNGWIVGGAWNGHDYSPLIMETKNGGQTWNSLPFAGDGLLYSVYFVSPDSGWTAGRQGQIFRTLNGGMSWFIQQGDKNYDIHSLYFHSGSNGWAVGDNGICLKTENSGQTWSLQSPGSDSFLADIFFTDDEHGWIVGGHGTILKTASAGLNLIPALSEPQNHALGLSRNLTLRWQPVSGASSYYVQVADDSLFAHLVYENGNIVTNEIFLSDLEENRTYYWRVKSFHEGKTSDWSLPRNFLTEGAWQAQFSTTRQKLNAVLFENLYNGVSVGDNGTILRTTDGGDTWKQLPLVCRADLWSVCTTPDNAYWVAGDSSILLHSVDGGASWQKTILSADASFEKIVFTSSNEGWAGGSAIKDQRSVAVLAHSTDGGKDWQLLFLDSLQSLNTLVFLDDKHGLAGGSGADFNLLRTNDGGRNWTPFNAVGSAEIRNLLFTDPAHGYLTTADGAFYTTADSGYTWTKAFQFSSAPVQDLFFIDDVNGFVLADGLYKTTDGGHSWQRFFADSLFTKIFFIDQNTGWLIGPDGLILKTTTAGSPLALREAETNMLPNKLELRQNFPNPFNPTTTISYTVGAGNYAPVHVRLTVYNALGQVVKELVNRKQLPGEYRVTFDARDLASGVYIYRLQTAGFSTARKLIFIK